MGFVRPPRLLAGALASSGERRLPYLRRIGARDKAWLDHYINPPTLRHTQSTHFLFRYLSTYLPGSLPQFLRLPWSPSSSPRRLLRLCVEISPDDIQSSVGRSARTTKSKSAFFADCIAPVPAIRKRDRRPAKGTTAHLHPKTFGFVCLWSGSPPRSPPPLYARQQRHTYTALPPTMADATNASDELYPIAVLIDRLKRGAGVTSQPYLVPPLQPCCLRADKEKAAGLTRKFDRSTTTSCSVSMPSTAYPPLPSP